MTLQAGAKKWDYLKTFMETLLILGTITVAHIIGVVSPGPDFVMCVRNSLIYSRRTGIYTSLGFAAGVGVHVSYCLAGLAVIISQSILLFNAIKLLGAGYLIYLGIKSLMSKSQKLEIGDHHKRADISRWKAFKIGFITNVLNPKATLWFLGIFTVVISPGTSIFILVVASAIMVITTALWFCLVAIFFTTGKIRGAFSKFQNLFNRTFGALLLALGLKIALNKD